MEQQGEGGGTGAGVGEMVKSGVRLFVWRIAPRLHIKGFLNFLSPGLLGCSI